MALNLDKLNSFYLLTSRESFRKKIIDTIQEYQDLKGVDLSKTQFFSYIIDIISTIGADNANALTVTRKENYLVTAAMPSSIYNWAAYLGYNKQLATPAKCDLLIKINLDFNEDVDFFFPKNHKFYAGNIVFSLPYKLNLHYTNSNNTIKCNLQNENELIELPVIIENNFAYISVQVIQYEIIDFDKRVPGVLRLYEPWKFDVSYKDFLYSIDLYVKDNSNDIPEKWQLVNNYFTMGINEKNYTLVFSDLNTVTILFGNGVFGKQPHPNSEIFGQLYVTKGYNGNVVSRTIKSGDPVYFQQNGLVKQVKYECINVDSAFGGKDEESLEEVKVKSIARFKSRHRLVTKDDYQNFDKIVDTDLPFPIIYPILKRSDLKMNEITLYTILLQEKKTYKPTNLYIESNENIMPATDVYIPKPTNSVNMKTVFQGPQKYNPLFQIDTIENGEIISWICPFGMMLENKFFAYFFYTVKNIDMKPNITYFDYVNYSDLSITKITISTDDNFENFTFRLYYSIQSIDVNNLVCQFYLKNKNTLTDYYEVNLSNTSNFVEFNLSDDMIKFGETFIYFNIKDPINQRTVCDIVNTAYLKKDMKNYMFSNCKYNSNTNEVTIYDIPVIEKTYWESLTNEEKIKFENTILQKIVSGLFLGKYRMLTNSINLKFAKTMGLIDNYYLNNVTTDDVIDIIDIPPTNPNDGDRYIVGQYPQGEFVGHTNEIAVYKSVTQNWIFFKAKPGDIVYIINKDKKYTFNGNANRWIYAIFKTPLDIDVFVKVKNSPYDNLSIINTVKNIIMYTLGQNFKIHGQIKRSEIYEAIQSLQNIGILYCEVRSPEVNLEFNYEIEDLNKDNLIDYTPVYLYTDEDHINVTISRE